MDKENEYSNIKKRRVYYRGLFRRFRVVSDVELTKEEISNIVFTIRDEKGTCDANVIARDLYRKVTIRLRHVRCQAAMVEIG